VKPDIRQRIFDRCKDMDGPIKGSPCLIWQGPKVHDPDEGYGTIPWAGPWRNKPVHRVVYELSVGIPEGLWVLHHCDQKDCCRLEHLYAGTPQDNADDMVERGFSPKGDIHANAVLSEKEAIEVLRLVVEGKQQYSQIARKFGVSLKAVSAIARGKTWKHLPGPRREPQPPGDWRKITVVEKPKASRFFAVTKQRGKWKAEINRIVYCGSYFHETQAALAVNDAIQILKLNKPLNIIPEGEAVMTTSKMEEDEYRRQVLRDDLRAKVGASMHAFAVADAAIPLGRFTQVTAATVVGSTANAAGAYPAASAAHQTELPPERSLGYSIDDLEPPAASLVEAQAGEPAERAPSPADVERAVGSSLSSRSYRRLR
jgi:hypothetical protein